VTHALKHPSLREKIVWGLFAATSLQLALLHPYVVLVPGERTNVFSGALCFLTLTATLVLLGGRDRGSLSWKSWEVRISLALLVLGTLSVPFSLAPFPSGLRVFVLLASGLGGFWCGRLVPAGPESRRLLLLLLLSALGGMLLLSLVGYAGWGKTNHFFDWHLHPLTSMILLLSFGPLALLKGRSAAGVWLGILLLGLSYLVLCLTREIFAMVVPVALAGLGALSGRLRLRYFLVVLLMAAAVIFSFRAHIPWEKFSKQSESFYYRLESIALTGKIVRQHPWFGIGLRTDRSQFLENFPFHYPYVPRENFVEALKRTVTCDVLFFTLMAGLGVPFTLLYFSALGVLCLRLWRLVRRAPGQLPFPPLSLLLPVFAGLLYFFVLDALLFPQFNWFFHLYLGLVPPSPAASLSGSGGDRP